VLPASSARGSTHTSTRGRRRLVPVLEGPLIYSRVKDTMTPTRPPHPLIADLRRLAVSAFDGDDSVTATAILGEVDHAVAKGEDVLRNAIAVSFVGGRRLVGGRSSELSRGLARPCQKHLAIPFSQVVVDEYLRVGPRWLSP
jgi:hypothetical protein